MPGRLSLRARLVLGVIVLAAAGLAVADIATYKALSRFLIHRTDVTLNAAHVAVENAQAALASAQANAQLGAHIGQIPDFEPRDLWRPAGPCGARGTRDGVRAQPGGAAHAALRPGGVSPAPTRAHHAA